MTEELLDLIKEELSGYLEDDCLSDYASKTIELIKEFNDKGLTLSVNELNNLKLPYNMHACLKKENELIDLVRKVNACYDEAMINELRININNELINSAYRIIYSCNLIIGSKMGRDESVALGATLNKLFIDELNKEDYRNRLYV